MKKQDFNKLVKHLKNKACSNIYGLYDSLLITSQFVIPLNNTGYSEEELKTLLDKEGFKNVLEEKTIKSVIPDDLNEFERIEVTDFYWKDKYGLSLYRILKIGDEYYIALALIFDLIFNEYDEIYIEKERVSLNKITDKDKKRIMVVNKLDKRI